MNNFLNIRYLFKRLTEGSTHTHKERNVAIFISCFISQMARTTRFGSVHIQELETPHWSLTQWQRQRFRAIVLCSPRCVSQKLGQKQSSWNLNWNFDMGCQGHNASRAHQMTLLACELILGFIFFQSFWKLFDIYLAYVISNM